MLMQTSEGNQEYQTEKKLKRKKET